MSESRENSASHGDATAGTGRSSFDIHSFNPHDINKAEKTGYAASITSFGKNHHPDPNDDNESIISRCATRSGDQKTILLDKMEQVGKHLSRVTTRDTFTIDPTDFDLAAILRSFLKNADRQLLKLRSTGVLVKDVATIVSDKSVTFAETFGKVLNIPGNIAEGIKNRGKNTSRRILNNISANVQAGEMCLVLGRPGAGCSTLLKTIAGEGLDQYLGTEGSISFDGIPQQEMLKSHKNDVVYNPELDIHFPHLTVKQTLKFAVGCRTPKLRVNAVSGDATVEQYIDFKTDLLATIFGLRHTYNTKVGNDFIRGVSGGERKRVSIAEALAADAKVYCWDNATRGLDASTALEYASALRVLTNLLNSTNLVTIYQASENIYQKFDKVLVLYEGRQIFFGLIHEAVPYFEEMGFQRPSRQVTPEFLTAITDPKGRFPKPGFENKVPRNAEEFEAYWLKSNNYQKLQEDIAKLEQTTDPEKTRQEFNESTIAEKSKIKSKYTVSYLRQLQLNFVRSYQIATGDFSYLLTQITADVIQSLITGSLYYNIPKTTAGAFSRGGVLFFCCLYYSLSGLASVSNSFSKRPILLKQKGYSFCHPSTEFFSSFVIDALFKLIGVICFIIIVFFLADLRRNGGHFFVVFLFVILTSYSMNGFFQMIANLCPTLSVANAICGMTIMLGIMYSCFMIQLPSMHPWFKWINYLNPIRYGFEGMMVDEFHHTRLNCTQMFPSGSAYTNIPIENKVCPFSGAEPGQQYVSGDAYMKVAFQYYFNHLWRNFGILMGFFIVFTAIAAFASEYHRSVSAGFDVLIFKKNKETKRIVEAKKNSICSSTFDIEKQSNSSTGTSADELKDEADEKLDESVFEGLGSPDVFIWQNVDYDVTLKDGTVRRLLNDVQGYVKPGTLTALMGESGAGKTTLLNTLSQRVDMGVITGDMLVNGFPLSHSFQRKTGYVQQQDVHFAELTVRESLRFAARLRRSRKIPDKEKLDYCEKIINILGMSSYADAIVGEPGFGLNVEQRKKLSIGVELVAKPSLLLFLDEPTSGLDSQSSWSIVKLLRELANHGQAILCTIHQPSSVLFEEFDRLLLLKKGGYTVYFGDIGKNSKTLLSYFESHGGRKCSDDENPAEYILEVIGAGATASATDDWGQLWRESEEFAQTTNEIFELINESKNNHVEETDPEMKNTFITPYYYQLYEVTKRVYTQFWRDPTYLMSKLMLMIWSSLFVGFTYWNAGHSIIGMQNNMFSIFMTIVVSAPLIHQIQDRALQSRNVFEVRESKSNTYHWSTLLLAQFFAEIPYHIVFGTIYFIALYFPVHRFYDSYTVGTYYLNYAIMFQLYYISFGLWILYMSPNLPSAAVLVSLCLSFMIAFCGVVQPPSLMPGFWTFMWKVSPYTYFIQNFMILSLHKLDIVCTAKEVSILNPPLGQTCSQYLSSALTETLAGYLLNPDATSSCEYCPYKVGDQYLTTVRISHSYLWRNFGFMWVYIGFNITAMICCYYFFRVRKGSIFGKFDPLSMFDLVKKKKQGKKQSHS